MTSEVFNIDCVDGMKSYPDKYFELAIVDPPYGIGMDGGVTYKRPSRPNSKNLLPKHPIKDWDSGKPNENYFKELFRVSRNQIICGGNYFTQFLPASMGWVYWGKMEDESNFSDGELIFTSFQRALKSFYLHQFHGTHGGKMRIHPTQKPVKLYRWLLKNYANPGDKILDTHTGSGSSRIAAYDMGFPFTGFEIDSDYFDAAEKRFQLFKSQMKMEFA